MRTLSLVVGILLIAPEALGAPESTPAPAGTATVPLEQLIPLYSQRQPPPPAPPTEALVKSELRGRLSADALQVEASFEVEVLADGRWTQVRLLQLDADTYPTALPTLDDATVGVVDGYLCLLTRKAGRQSFDVSLTVRSSGTGPERRAQLRFGPQVSPVPLALEADTSVFTLLESLPSSGEGYALYPVQGALRVGWKAASQVAQATKPQVRPPLEPRISEATATWVSTLEGQATLRVGYTLSLDREQALELSIPEGHALERVTLNAIPVPVEAVTDGVLRLKVAPARLGETSGALEVVLTRELGVFHLSGRLKLALPRVSWPVAELRARAHFPAVFNYRREGGSLEQFEAAEATSQGATLPGKVLHFRQYLVAASSPTLELGYSVDISNSYFR
ncbi:hypothetical protein SAMN05443572_107182 [Myxococcus fulvus]|uniref:Lipoprotein n=1 Tax=Myxococcus fulvus TaxID=33 RepID=A0A511T8V0_MYXFU|nr:hypothetical protein [Myxococcus fulvus]GEN09912.1 hypothetical protein MFU01_49490 [Myxococcus fulvus]SEU25957.1 hypothetical protein SAMN05443572_107182 [Myxococcus fulvus]